MFHTPCANKTNLVTRRFADLQGLDLLERGTVLAGGTSLIRHAIAFGTLVSGYERMDKNKNKNKNKKNKNKNKNKKKNRKNKENKNKKGSKLCAL